MNLFHEKSINYLAILLTSPKLYIYHYLLVGIQNASIMMSLSFNASYSIDLKIKSNMNGEYNE